MQEQESLLSQLINLAIDEFKESGYFDQFLLYINQKLIYNTIS